MYIYVEITIRAIRTEVVRLATELLHANGY